MQRHKFGCKSRKFCHFVYKIKHMQFWFGECNFGNINKPIYKPIDFVHQAKTISNLKTIYLFDFWDSLYTIVDYKFFIKFCQ